MQKLMKRKMHYETIMPIEAYEDEALEEAYFWTLWGGMTGVGAAAIYASNPVGWGVLAAGAAITVADHYYHDEMLDAYVAAGESELERQNIEQANHDAMHNTVVNIVDNIVEGIEALGDYEPDTPGSASGPLQPVH